MENKTTPYRTKEEKWDKFGMKSHIPSIYLCICNLFSCVHSITIIDSSLCMTSSLKVMVFVKKPFFFLCSWEEALCCVTSAVLWPCVSEWRKHLQQSQQATAKGRGTASQLSSHSLTPASFLPSSGVCVFVLYWYCLLGLCLTLLCNTKLWCYHVRSYDA